MKKVVILLFVGMFFINSGIFPQKPGGKNTHNTTGDPSYTYLNLNNISTIFRNNGISDIDISLSNSGFKYPKETGKTAVFISGLLWGVKIAGDPQVRVGGSAYVGGLQGGKILSPGIAEDSNAPHVRIYRVRPDVYPGGPTVDLSWEAFDEGKTEAEVRAQYELDWIEWRAIDGAPFKDVDEDSLYDPTIDIPGISDAVQTIWFVANDLEPVLTFSLYGTLPIGIEYQATIWEYGDALGFDNFFYRKYKLINKSLDTFDSMYVSMWSDPDVGNDMDDFVGCDTLLSLGYAYNAFEVDSGYLPLPPPAVGFDLIRGPLVTGNPGEDRNNNGVDDIYDFGLTEDNQRVNGFINLPMTAFYYFVRGDPNLFDPPMGDPEGATQFYNFMQGKIGITGEYFINPVTGLPTTFALSGNPVTGEGWIDGLLQGPGDRRLGLSTGPIQMAPGDTQIVVIAEIAAGAIDGVTRMMAIDTLKYYSDIAQTFYNNVIVPVELTSFTANVNNKGDVILNWTTATELNNQMFEIERRSEDGQYIMIGYVNGHGTTTESQEYSYVDNTVETGTFFYRLKQIDFLGTYEYSDEVEVEVKGPLTFGLEQNYPNPFNPSTNVKYSVPEMGVVKLSIYSVIGEEAAVLVDGIVQAGFYEITFDASNLPSGVYFYRLQAGSFIKTKKMLLLK